MEAGIVAAGLALLALAGAGWAVTRTAPARLTRTVRECTELVAELESAWRTERASLVAWLEEAQAVLDSVERKRRQVTGAAGRLANAVPQEPDLTNSSPEQIRDYFTRVARTRGLLT